MHILILIAVVVIAVVASAQTAGVPGGTGPVGLVFPVPGHAVSAQQVEERTRSLPDGTSINETMVSQIYRDSAGRMRIEWGSEEGHRNSSSVIYLIDPVAYSTAILLVESRIAVRTDVPRSSPEGFQVGFPAVGVWPPGRKWQIKTESLGTRTIGGVEVEGARHVSTSEDQPPLTAVQAVWSSRSLGLTLEVEASGPNWKHTAKLQNLDRHDPDPALFVIPPDYAIQK
jgi:hypothetical protein